MFLLVLAFTANLQAGPLFIKGTHENLADCFLAARAANRRLAPSVIKKGAGYACVKLEYTI